MRISNLESLLLSLAFLIPIPVLGSLDSNSGSGFRLVGQVGQVGERSGVEWSGVE